MAQVGLEPTASLVLSQGGLPLPTEPVCAQGGIRTRNRSGLSRAAVPKFAYLGLHSGPGWSRTIVSWVWTKRRCRWTTGPADSVESPGVAPESPACRAGVFLLDHDPAGGSRGTRTHKRQAAATCFQDRLLIRPDGFPLSSCGGWNRTNMKTFRTSRPTVRRPRITF